MDKEYWGARWGKVPERAGDTREPSERDLARIIHSPAFRRLQGKTQVLGVGENDFYRTRLTHSIEVAQIAASLARHHHRSENSPEDLRKVLPTASHITAISLFHDVGHPPFGHGGELALNRLMYGCGGFEGNAQTLRICTRLGTTYSEHGGLNLSRRILLGLLKYPAPYSKVCDTTFIGERVPDGGKDLSYVDIDYDLWEPAKCFYDSEGDVVDWMLEGLTSEEKERFMHAGSRAEDHELCHAKTSHKSLDGSIMDLSDDISYGVHDLEDAIHLGLVSREDWCNLVKPAFDKLMESNSSDEMCDIENRLFDKSRKWEIKNAIGDMINCFINSSEHKKENFTDPILAYRIVLEGPYRDFLNAIQKLIVKKVIKSTRVQTLEFRGLQIVTRLFDTLRKHPDRLLNEETRIKYEGATNKADELRVISDHVAGMTDDYATKLYERLFVPRRGSLFEKI